VPAAAEPAATKGSQRRNKVGRRKRVGWPIRYRYRIDLNPSDMVSVTAASGFRRLALATGAVVAAGVAAFVALSLLIPADAVRNAVKAELRAVTGLDPTVLGEASVSLLPWGQVSFSQVVLGADRPGEPPLAAARVTARLRLLPLLMGRIEAADLSLLRPRIIVSFDPDGRSNWAGLITTIARTLSSDGAHDERVSLSEIRIADGTIEVEDRTHGIAETLTAAEMSLAWPSISKSFAATGHFTWRGEVMDTSISLADLLAAANGDRSGLKVRLSGVPFKLAFDGHMTRRPTFKMEGTLAADTASLRQAMVWAGHKPLPGGGFGRFALKAQTFVAGSTIALSPVNVELDNNIAEGVLTIATDGHSSVQGTLAADEIDLSPYISTVQLLRSAERDWSPVPIALDGLSDFDLDLRLSAAHITVANVKLGRTAVAANLRDGRFSVVIGESQAFGGVLKGSFGLARSPAGADVKSQLQFDDVDLESCLGELFGVRRLEGRGGLAFAMDASGDSVLALTKTMNGAATLTARQGALAGFNIEQLLRRLERRPLSRGGEFRSGRTAFDKLTVAIKFAQGTATVEDVRLDGSAVRIGLAGSASIPARDLDLKGTAGLVPASATESSGFELPFVVQGPWDDPFIAPDPEALMRRSPAVTPFLRDQKTRDTVNKLLDQLSGGGILGPPGGQAAPDPATNSVPPATR
jgi:AsmA protein